MPRVLIALCFLCLPLLAIAEPETQVAPLSDEQMQQFEAEVDVLEEPLYSPFIERYVLDELKQLRTDMASQRNEMIQQIVNREINAVDKAVTYSTNTVTYFFYLIAGATSILVLVGWTSIREIKERVHSLADEEISKLVMEYEQRLHAIELQLNQKTQHIAENREEIERTQELQSLWLRAAQENTASHKIGIYDHILKIKRDDCEALTYKADAVLELGEPQWAANLCHQALLIDPLNSHAFYQLACAYTTMGQFEEALYYLKQAISRSESYREEIALEPALQPLQDHPGLQKLLYPSEEKS
ncbi:MAG TPA: hypothetical protein DCE77_01470 [Methylophaga sp.]|jgi:tetratricopeptide (TPR) repeat protein|uniref:TPR end-of-group domain-containing protein n=1 Tax=unclassified Methylophaga TaxID=2629249 RepID=UPI000C8CD9C3|nr:MULTISPECIES: tetratricopeptide repeat protein [unclassified Methylophaga]MAP27816.1 hypothetical protein [Methylophaga sp.]HAD30221.1 hypothetical protein [Methylophaga sp.]HCN99367.1 hypothetical protein [Methylophaga sp.]|tara:strand:+ start:1197 stop:2099 length:903 start_codon:yes stop_codon:yes gene_type:complete